MPAEAAAKAASDAVRNASLFDGEIRFPGYFGSLGKCRIRVFGGGDGVPAVVCTELDDNPGTSVTNAAETIATLVWTALGRPEQFTWIEHYPDRLFIGTKPMMPEDFDVVRFDRVGNRLVRPRWRRVSKQEAERLCGVLL